MKVSGESNPQRLAQTLAVLRPVISSASLANPQSLAVLMGSVCGALCGRAVLEADSRSEEGLWEEELEACRAVVESGFGDELRRPQIRLDVSLEGVKGRGVFEVLRREMLGLISRSLELGNSKGAVGWALGRGAVSWGCGLKGLVIPPSLSLPSLCPPS